MTLVLIGTAVFFYSQEHVDNPGNQQTHISEELNTQTPITVYNPEHFTEDSSQPAANVKSHDNLTTQNNNSTSSENIEAEDSYAAKPNNPKPIMTLSERIKANESKTKQFLATVPDQVKRKQGYNELQRLMESGYLQMDEESLSYLPKDEQSLVKLLKLQKAANDEIHNEGRYLRIDEAEVLKNGEIIQQAFIQGNTAIAMQAGGIYRIKFNDKPMGQEFL